MFFPTTKVPHVLNKYTTKYTTIVMETTIINTKKVKVKWNRQQTTWVIDLSL